MSKYEIGFWISGTVCFGLLAAGLPYGVYIPFAITALVCLVLDRWKG